METIPSAEEIYDIVKFMGLNKAPSPDGLPVMFYKEYWHIISWDVIAMVQGFFNGGHLLSFMSHTFIVLIPKIENPYKVQHYHPINLCNVSYKIISKLIALRLKPFLSRMISEQQSTFVPGHLIQDNFILTHEIFHALTLKRGKKGNLVLKIDMTKAYDRIEWDLILLGLKMFDSSPRWINWVKECLSLVSYLILLNGSSYGFITPSKGLHQGDPMSLFLFFIGMEILSRLLDKAHSLLLVNGICLNMGVPSVYSLIVC